MFQGSTDFLSYVLIVFLMWIYLPYTLFRFSAEFFIDLGRRRDATQLEEIIGAFLPGGVLCGIACLIFWGLHKHAPDTFNVDWAVLASMFGQNRGAISDYIYAGNWLGCVYFLIILWSFALVNGLAFGRAAQLVMRQSTDTLDGLDSTMHKYRFKFDRPEKIGRLKKTRIVLRFLLHWIFWWWHIFFEESFAPLYPWREQRPRVRIETRDHRIYEGEFVTYEKTTDGKMDAIRLCDVNSFRRPVGKPPNVFRDEPIHLRSLYLNWSELSDISIVTVADVPKV